MDKGALQVLVFKKYKVQVLQDHWITLQIRFKVQGLGYEQLQIKLQKGTDRSGLFRGC